MNYQSRSFESRGEAMRRDHLMPVVGSTWSKVRSDYAIAGEHWTKTLFGWFLIGSVVAALLVLA